MYEAFMNEKRQLRKWTGMHCGIHGVGGNLLDAAKPFSKNSKPCVKIDSRLSKSFEIGLGVRQGHVMSPWLFSGAMRKMKARLGREGTKLEFNGKIWPLVTSLFADSLTFLAERREITDGGE